MMMIRVNNLNNIILHRKQLQITEITQNYRIHPKFHIQREKIDPSGPLTVNVLWFSDIRFRTDNTVGVMYGGCTQN